MEGFLLSEWFRMNEVRYGTKQVGLDSWCTLALKDGGEDVGYGSMQVALPNALVEDEGTECFYCGLKNHAPKNCPTKKISKPQPQVWHLLAKTNVQDFTEGFAGVDESVDMENFTDSITKVMSGKNDLKSLMARSVFEINAIGQLRTLKLVWRSRGKEWVDGFKQLAPPEGDFIWDALADIENGRMEEAEISHQGSSDQVPEELPAAFPPGVLVPGAGRHQPGLVSLAGGGANELHAPATVVFFLFAGAVEGGRIQPQGRHQFLSAHQFPVSDLVAARLSPGRLHGEDGIHRAGH